MKRFTKKDIRLNNFKIEMFLNEPKIILWSVIEELKDIYNSCLSNSLECLLNLWNRKKIQEHFIHQIDRLENLLNSIEQEDYKKNWSFVYTKTIKDICKKNLKKYKKNSLLDGYEGILNILEESEEE